ncbi:MAG: MarR family transcriptional regulator [Lachnospiraceae bacterium]|nr:MarR family transcriptional regulator [Lachnospiraceae bacterium]
MEESIIREIHVLSNRICRLLDNAPERRRLEEVTGKNTWIIGYIAHNEGTDVFQRDLEKQFGITRSTASKVVNRMVKKGIIERQSVPEDARLKKLVLTERSREIHQRMEAEFRDMEDTLVEGFSAEEIEQMREYLLRMQNNMKKKEERRND